jgi:hypothetical protein
MNRLNLLPPFKNRLIIIVLILAIAYIALPDYIINMGIGIMQIINTKN